MKLRALHLYCSMHGKPLVCMYWAGEYAAWFAWSVTDACHMLVWTEFSLCVCVCVCVCVCLCAPSQALCLRLHAIVHCAATATSECVLTQDNVESHFAINYLNPLLLTLLLLPFLGQGRQSSSGGHPTLPVSNAGVLTSHTHTHTKKTNTDTQAGV